jgi:two-component system phosphate regulon sensor histidine kinase PhoR
MREKEQEFLANVAHELKTPITVIRGFAETLLDISSLSDVTAKEMLATILSTSIRLEKLVHGLGLLAEIENLSKDLLQQVDVISLCKQCKLFQLAVHQEASISIHCAQDEAFVEVNAELFEIAIMNLLDNAIKYSISPAHIEVRICLLPNFTLEIEDHGIGIAEKDIPHIFDRFYAVDKSKARKTKSIGLGLSIVKTIVEKHGGKITLSSKVGQGTRFTITLPHSS